VRLFSLKSKEDSSLITRLVLYRRPVRLSVYVVDSAYCAHRGRWMGVQIIADLIAGADPACDPHMYGL